MGLLANLFAVANSGDDKEPPGVLNLADDPVIADTVTPQSSLVAGQGFAITAGVLVGGDADIEVASKLVSNVGIQLAQVPAGGAAEADFER